MIASLTLAVERPQTVALVSRTIRPADVTQTASVMVPDVPWLSSDTAPPEATSGTKNEGNSKRRDKQDAKKIRTNEVDKNKLQEERIRISKKVVK